MKGIYHNHLFCGLGQYDYQTNEVHPGVST